jgi:hypothetical protein
MVYNRKMRKSSKIIIVISILVLACLGVYFVEAQTKILHRALDNFVYDNENHYLPCDELPTEVEVRAVVQAHQDVIRAIEAVGPGFIGVEVDTFTCPGKADLLIWYGTHQDRLGIKDIIDADTFFGVPYRMVNR